MRQLQQSTATAMYAIKNVRLKKYNYRSDGYYFITAVCNWRDDFFKSKEKIVEAQLQDLVKKIPGLSLDYFVVMPNHVHIIFILRHSILGLGKIVRRFKAKISHSFGKNVWQPNYYEHVIRNEKALNKIREYIDNNPQELLLKFDQFYV